MSKLYSSKDNFSGECESALNKQIKMELEASYTYMSMNAFCSRDGVSLPGLAAYCAQMSSEERDHAITLQDYVNKRGGTVIFEQIHPHPKASSWDSAVTILETMLELEKNVNQSLLKLVKLADAKEDAQLADFIEGEFLTEQVESIKELTDLLTQLQRVGSDGLGLYLWDQNLLAKTVNK